MTYDVFPSPANLERWGVGKSSNCHLCGKFANLHHILSACHVALSSGWYTFRHNLVLKVAVKAANEVTIPEKKTKPISFVRAGVRVSSRRPKRRVVGQGRKWEVLEEWAWMLAAVDSCFGLLGLVSTAQLTNRLTRFLRVLVLSPSDPRGHSALFSGCVITSTHVQHNYILYSSHIPQALR